MDKIEQIDTKRINRKKKLQQLLLIHIQLNEIKELIVSDKDISNNQKEKFLHMYINTIRHITILNYYLDYFTTSRTLEYVFEKILRFFSKFIKGTRKK